MDDYCGIVFTKQLDKDSPVDFDEAVKLDPSVIFLTYDGKRFLRFGIQNFIFVVQLVLISFTFISMPSTTLLKSIPTKNLYPTRTGKKFITQTKSKT